MKKLLAILICFTIHFVSGQTRQVLVSPMDELKINAGSFAGNDEFGFSYFIKDNAFFKLKNGQSVEYKNLSYGKLAKVDLLNPLKIVLFYENFNTIVTLDNQLNETQRISLSETEPSIIVSATGMASQNRLWIFDTLSQKLGLYDYLKNAYTFITPPFQGNFKYYTTDFNYFQWIDESNNWFRCDVFGKISNLGKLPDFDAIQITNEQLILFSKDGKLFLNDPKNNKTYIVDNIDKSAKSFFLKGQILAIFTDHGITNYKITIP
ncbi:hypothetical protein [Flavobacterium sp. 3HN19-14]|uniref:hypothetical protein n=1 Tax=Flavobacterium sp. 3HN19-14 TaxID=3448133 RepID=UPI003EDF4A9E